MEEAEEAEEAERSLESVIVVDPIALVVAGDMG